MGKETKNNELVTGNLRHKECEWSWIGAWHSVCILLSAEQNSEQLMVAMLHIFDSLTDMQATYLFKPHTNFHREPPLHLSSHCFPAPERLSDIHLCSLSKLRESTRHLSYCLRCSSSPLSSPPA